MALRQRAGHAVNAAGRELPHPPGRRAGWARQAPPAHAAPLLRLRLSPTQARTCGPSRTTSATAIRATRRTTRGRPRIGSRVSGGSCCSCGRRAMSLAPASIDRVTKWWEDLDETQRQALVGPSRRQGPARARRLCRRPSSSEADALLDGPATHVLLWGGSGRARRRRSVGRSFSGHCVRRGAGT